MSWSEKLFFRLTERSLLDDHPEGFAGTMKVKRTALGSAWLVRREVEEESVVNGGWNVLVLSLLSCIALTAIATMLIDASLLPFLLVAAVLAPLIASSLFLNAPESFALTEERAMLREAPLAIGRMTMSMQIQPSLEKAVVFAARGDGGVLSGRFSEAMWSALTRTKSNLNTALLDLSAALSDANSSLRQSLHLVVSATCERTPEGMHRLLDKANSVALGGVREAVDRYASSLSIPTMVLFSLGTLLPIMLFSVLPLLSIGTAMAPGQTTDPLPLPYIAFLLLAILPGAALFYSWTVLAKNPLGLVQGQDAVFRPAEHLPFLVAWAAAVIVAVMIEPGDYGPFVLSGAVILPPCVYIALRLRGGNDRKRRERIEADAISALFQMGNRMISGSTLENALEGAAASKGGAFSELVRSLLHRSRVTGKGLAHTIVEDGTLREVAPILENAFVTVAQCAERDPCYSGQVALNLAQMLTELNSCRGKIEERLRGIIDMMRSTGTVFAPIVLGVTGSLFALIGGQVGSPGTMAQDIALITGVYIGELSFLISFFTVLVMGERSWKGILHQYAVRTPVAFVVFVAVSLICRTGLSALL